MPPDPSQKLMSTLLEYVYAIKSEITTIRAIFGLQDAEISDLEISRNVTGDPAGFEYLSSGVFNHVHIISGHAGKLFK